MQRRRPAPYLMCALALAAVLTAGRWTRPAADGPPYEPEAALATFELAEGFRIEPFAAEPLVQDPVDMAVDEYGRVYVVEMPGYPLDTGGSGRVKLLRDTDGDGRPDRSTLFAEGLTLPTGIMRWKAGVLITDPPDVLYLEDTDGDGRADRRQVVLTGFALSNPQHNANNPLYGLDNGIYIANGGTIWWTEAYKDLFGDRGQEVHFPDRPAGPRLGRNAYDRNVRFRPDTYELESLASESQFGHTFDTWGRHLLVDNSHHQYHEVMAARYLQRNPDLPVRDATHGTPDHGDAAVVYPITRSPEHQLLTDRGVFTSAAGLTYYLGALFPPPFDHAAFVAEPVHNLVHVDLVADNGATFTARRLYEGREFLASTDAWFRPVNFYIGPDGALYVIDYYRQIVEHPEWMSDEAIRSGNLYNGSDRGRIWRIVPEGTPPPTWTDDLHLGEASAAELVRTLAHPNIWWRRTAQRLLVDRQDPAAVPHLAQLFRDSPAPPARLHALWTLEGLGALDAGWIRAAMQDEAPGVRENAVRLAERHLEEAPALAAPLLALEHDPDPKVRYQLLLTLGDLPSEAARGVRRRLLFRDLEDEWMQLAALSARTGADPDLFARAAAHLTDRETEGRRTYFRRIGMMLGARPQAEAVQQVVREVTREADPASAWWRAAVLEGLAEGLRGSEARAELGTTQHDLTRQFFSSPPVMRRAYLDLLGAAGLPPGPSGRKVLAEAARLAADREADPGLRADAVRLLALSDPAAHAHLFEQAVDAREPASVQRAAVAALGRIEGAAVGTFLLERWAVMTPEIRDAAIDALMEDEARLPLLVGAIRDGLILPSLLGWGRTVVLMRDTEGAVRDEARALLREAPGARAVAVERYGAALSRPGDAARGRAVFVRACAPCHRKDDLGTAFGPDLGTVRHWTREDLLTHILMPSKTIVEGYELWLVERRRGGSVSGVVAAETPTSITLRVQGGGEVVIPRTDIRSITAAPVSAMPDGLEGQVSVEEMADLLAFLKD